MLNFDKKNIANAMIKKTRKKSGAQNNTNKKLDTKPKNAN